MQMVVHGVPAGIAGVWWALRLLHRCRRITACEAPAEGWTSVLKYLWHPLQAPHDSVLIGRLKLRLAGVRGDGADDAFVSQADGPVANLTVVPRGLNTRLKVCICIGSAYLPRSPCCPSFSQSLLQKIANSHVSKTFLDASQRFSKRGAKTRIQRFRISSGRRGLSSTRGCHGPASGSRAEATRNTRAARLRQCSVVVGLVNTVRSLAADVGPAQGWPVFWLLRRRLPAACPQLQVRWRSSMPECCEQAALCRQGQASITGGA
jgi:hypothetical protein